ncbi:MAG: hypothetical protein D3M94_05875 [Rhodocyclales bacterium GT-UBC]|nr:MAG: hypothetical protein D3M94_05875 [Rhodocyclales bacterium GT-UBC]
MNTAYTNRPTIRRLLRGSGIALLMLGYPLLAHYASTEYFIASKPEISAGIALAPTLLLFLWLVSRTGTITLLILTAVGLGLLRLSWPFLEQNFGWIYFIQHATTNLLLAFVFGRTLRRGQKPLIKQMAECLCGELSAAAAQYARRVTQAWVLFFAGMAALSALLFAAASLESWSIFANLLSMPLLTLMFVAEYLTRRKCLPDEEHKPLDSIRAYLKMAEEKKRRAMALAKD